MENKPTAITVNPPAQGIERYLEGWQVQVLRKKTPASFIKKNYDGYSYVPGHRFLDMLDKVFCGLWSFAVVERFRDGDNTIVHGRLTVKVPLPNGTFLELSKEQFGTDTIQYKKSDKTVALDIGNNYKSASTDALKKCAVAFGLFRDVYLNDEDRAQRHAELDAVDQARKSQANQTASNFVD